MATAASRSSDNLFLLKLYMVTYSIRCSRNIRHKSERNWQLTQDRQFDKQWKFFKHKEPLQYISFREGFTECYCDEIVKDNQWCDRLQAQF